MVSKVNQSQLGLYTPDLERDSCGVGLLADLNGQQSRYIVDSALTVLENMEHRGACGCEENTGDGAGILTQIPFDFFNELAINNEVKLPAPGKYGVGMFFFPRDIAMRKYCYDVIEKYCLKHDFKIIMERQVPTDNSMIGESAKKTEPIMTQLFFKSSGFNNKDLERRLYFLRSQVMKEIYFSDKELTDDFYIVSLSSRTIVYKGMLTANQLRAYFPDLQKQEFKSAVAIVHSRFSTNTVPKWKLAQPFRCIAHNGEINTIQGNINWWNAREKHMELVAKNRPVLSSVFPVCDPFISDSGNFDNVVDFLLHSSRSIPHSIMMMIPEAWQNDKHIEDYKKAFYEYHDAVLEPWDGPASICFTDGTVLGATLDRNGLRPSRYMLTDDNILMLGSEAGCLPIDQSKIVLKGRLQPGKMLVADLDENRIISDKELKERICKRRPYREWLDTHAKTLEDLAINEEYAVSELPLSLRQIAFGLTVEDKEMIIDTMSDTGKEPIGSMGSDVPLAVLSQIAQHPANYFKQQFAQVTNPPIDPLRENFYMSLSTVISSSSAVIGIAEAEAELIRVDVPVLTNTQYASLLHNDIDKFKGTEVSCLYATDDTLEDAIDHVIHNVLDAIAEDNRIICLTDIGLNDKKKAIPSLLIVGALHHFLIEKGLRKEVTLVIRMGDIWETHHLACLLSYGADYVCPYLAFETVTAHAIKNTISTGDAIYQYISALKKGLLKIMSKLGISTLASYKGAQTFEAIGIHESVIAKCFKGTISRIEV
mgnify:CR=1 FL=1